MLLKDKLKHVVYLLRHQSLILKRFYARNLLHMDLDLFVLANSEEKYRYFYHGHNIEYFGYRYSERIVELALADRWLDKCQEAWEIGAVTPYYWPKRVLNVIDPADIHPQVNFHGSLFDYDLSGKDILSISTIEHIGQSQYGLEENADAVQALRKITSEANNFLITFPVGWNKLLDDFVFAGGADDWCNVRFLVRKKYELWEPAPSIEARLPYGGKDPWAKSVAILDRGNKL